MESFLKGLNGIIPDNLLSIFDENELELLLCGTGEYSISDFRCHHIINGNSPEFRKVLGWFWTAVSNFSQTEMARLLQFTTGCSQLPPGGFQVSRRRTWFSRKCYRIYYREISLILIVECWPFSVCFCIWFCRSSAHVFKSQPHRHSATFQLPILASINCVCLITRNTSSSSVLSWLLLVREPKVLAWFNYASLSLFRCTPNHISLTCMSSCNNSVRCSTNFELRALEHFI